MSKKPRILCLHGGGVSGRIFELQMRYFIKRLAGDFRLVFVDGPWHCKMHDDLKPVYLEMGPCYRWANWLPHHPLVDEFSAIRNVEYNLVKAMSEDDGVGPWVGILGFSQGAKLAFSILLENELRLQKDLWAPGFAGVHWNFGVIMAGRGPPYSLDPTTQTSRHLSSLTGVSRRSEKALLTDGLPGRLRTPTLHVHGLRDADLELHRELQERFASPSRARLVEWDGAHRLPIRTADVERVTNAILEIAKPIVAYTRGLTPLVGVSRDISGRLQKEPISQFNSIQLENQN